MRWSGRFLWLAAVCAVSCAAARGASVVANGGFEAPDPADPQRPAHWQQPDGLGAQWTEAPAQPKGTVRGRAVRLDTRVPEHDMVARWRAQGLDAWVFDDPKKNPIAATYGLSFYSEAVRVTPGQAYRIAFDHLAEGGAKGAMVWVRGYGVVRASARVRERDVRDWAGLADELRAGAPAAASPAGRVWAYLPESVRALVEETPPGAAPAAEERPALARALTSVLLEPDLYARDAWQGVRLDADTRALLADHAQGKLRRPQILRLNRYLLEAAWPAALAPSRERRHLYDTYVNCFVDGAAWTHFDQVFHPTRRTPKVTEMRVMLFAYWPPGVYWFDNVSVTPAPLEDWEAQRARDQADLDAYRKAREAEHPAEPLPAPGP